MLRVTFYGLLLLLTWQTIAIAYSRDLMDYNYRKTRHELSGIIQITGSDTLSGMLSMWRTEFMEHHPNVTVLLETKGSSSGPPALSSGKAQLAPMSREMKRAERQAFHSVHNYWPTQLRVALDGIGVYVNAKNPLEQLTLAELDAIFSEELRCGRNNTVLRWGQVGVRGSLADETIITFGRNALSGTYGFFRKKALCGGQFREDLLEKEDSVHIVQAIRETTAGIGYGGLGFEDEGVHHIKLSEGEGKPAYDPTVVDIARGNYPLARELYIYVDKPSNRPLPRLEREFMKLVFSKQGQEIVEEQGFVPLLPSIAQRQWAKTR